MKSYLDKREKLLKARMGTALETPVNPDFRMEMDNNQARVMTSDVMKEMRHGGSSCSKGLPGGPNEMIMMKMK